MAKINVLDKDVTIYVQNDEDYICLTDMARYKDPDRTDYIIQNWLRSRTTIEFLGIWEQLNNPDFKPIEFDGFRKQAGLNSFVLTAKQWIEKTRAIGLVSKAGRYGGTYAHKDIAFEFASWISVEFKLYLIKEFQRLKDEERKQLGWDIRRNLTKINYRIHT
ncbi:MAG: KilA-N domain-containing protein, partial [Chloroflexota bacterium]